MEKIADFYSLKYSTYARIVTSKMTIKIGKKSFETVNIALLGKANPSKLLKAWAEIGVEISNFSKQSDPTTEMIAQYQRMNDKRLGILICMRVLQDRESANAVAALQRLGVTCGSDRFEAFKAAKAMYTGISGNMEDIEAELKQNEQKPPTYNDYIREFNIVNKQMGGSMNFENVLLVQYLDARQYIKEQNDRNQPD